MGVGALTLLMTRIPSYCSFGMNFMAPGLTISEVIPSSAARIGLNIQELYLFLFF
ncbi:hypothetical protein D3C87_2146840 [compost metagenome]